MKDWGDIYSSRSFSAWLISISSNLVFVKDDSNKNSSNTSINSEVGEIGDNGRSHLRQQLKLYGKYTFLSTSMNFMNVNELSITLFVYVLTFNSINGWTTAPNFTSNYA